MASIGGFRFDVSGASGSQGLLGPKNGWRAYFFPRGGYASQDSTGNLITFDSVQVASRFSVGNWLQAGLATANIRQVGAVGGNSLSVSGSALTVAENTRIYLIGNTEPTVSGGSATYTTPNTLIRQRDDDGADLYTNSMITTNSDGLVQGFSLPAWYDVLIQDGNQANQGSIVDLWVQDDQPVVYTSNFAVGSSTAGILEAINSLPSTGGKVVLVGSSLSITGPIGVSNKEYITIEGQGWNNTTIDAGSNAINIFDFSGTCRFWVMRDFAMKSTGDVATGIYFNSGSPNGQIKLDTIRFDSLAFGIANASGANPTISGYNCDFRFGTNGIYLLSGGGQSPSAAFYSSLFRNNSGYGIRTSADRVGIRCFDCTIANNDGFQVQLDGAEMSAFYGCLIERDPANTPAGTELVRIQVDPNDSASPCRNLLFSNCYFFGGANSDYVFGVGDGTTNTQLINLTVDTCRFNGHNTAVVFTHANTPVGTGLLGQIRNCDITSAPAGVYFDAANGGNRWFLNQGPFFGGTQGANDATSEGIWFFKTNAGTSRLEMICRTVASTVKLFSSLLLSESNDRLRIMSSGDHYFGDGTTGPRQWGVHAGQTITAAGQSLSVTVNNHDIVLPLSSDAGYTLSAQPVLSNGSFNGQQCTIFNEGSFSLIFPDGVSFNLRLQGSTNFTLGPDDTMKLIWSQVKGDWLQVSGSDN